MKPFCGHCMHMLSGDYHIPCEDSIAIMPSCRTVSPDSEEAREHRAHQELKLQEQELIF